MTVFAGADAVKIAEGRMDMSRWPGMNHPAGVRELGMHTEGFPRNLGGPRFSTRTRALVVGEPRQQISGSVAGVSAGDGSETRTREWYGRATPRSLPDGTLGVGAFHSTVEAGERTRADPVEERGSRFTELLEGHMAGTQEPGAVLTKQQRIARLAGDDSGRAFTSLAHHMDLDWLMEAYHRTRKDGAVGGTAKRQKPMGRI